MMEHITDIEYHTCARERASSEMNPKEWVSEDQDCWYKCGNKGGSCQFCGQGGYCCRNTYGYNGNNGDCPIEALAMMEYITKVDNYRVCIRKK